MYKLLIFYNKIYKILFNNGALLTTSDAIICSNLIRNTDIPSKIYLDYLKNNK